MLQTIRSIYIYGITRWCNFDWTDLQNSLLWRKGYHLFKFDGKHYDDPILWQQNNTHMQNHADMKTYLELRWNNIIQAR